MKIVLVSNNPQDSDALKKELNEQAPAIDIEAVLNSQSAFTYLASSVCDAILLDASVPAADAANLVSATRLTKKSVAIVALVATYDKYPPTELIRAGVDKYISKSPGFISSLEEALFKAMERRRAESVLDERQIRIIYAGNLQDIQPHLSKHPHWILEPAVFEPDGLLRLPEIESYEDAIIVIDSAVSGKQILDAVKDVKRRTPDTPLILLTEPEDEVIPIQALSAGASDCVTKKESYIQRLLPVVEREIKRRQIIREKEAGQSREESLRQVIETMPVGITVISPDGTFLAVNQAGLKLLGAERLDQIIGNSIVRLLPQEERDKVVSFLASISQGTETSVQLDWRGLDGTISGTELRAVPMRRGSAGTIVALAVITPAANGQTDQMPREEAGVEIGELKKSLQESEARYRELQDKDSLAKSNLTEELRKAQSGQAAAEEQLAILRKTVEEAEARCTNLVERQRTERAGWEQARESYKEQCAKIESMAQSLRDAQETLLKTHDAERAKWETRFQEMEQEKKSAEALLNRISEESRQERSKWEVARQESERKLRAAEEQRSSLDSALQEAQTGLAQMEENFNAERSEWDLVRQDLEQKLQAAEAQSSLQNTTLQETQSRLIHLEKTLGTERSQWNLARQEFEQKLQAIEKRHSAEGQSILSDAESRIAAIQEQNQILSTRMDEAQQEIEQLKSDKEKLAEELTETRLRYQRLSQVSTVGFVMAACDGQVLECNDAAARMFGFNGAEEALAASGQDEFRIYAFEGVLAARLQQEGRLENIEWSSQGRDGRVVRFQENARVVEAPAGESSLVERVLTDITRIHRLGQEIRRTRRLESTGDLAAATVRSLKSLCASLENCGKSLMNTPDNADTVRQTAEAILKSVRRGIKHSTQFLSISVKTERVPGLINLNEILSDNEHLLRSLAGEDIDLQTILFPRVGLVTADQQELIQLISSLVASSREALPLGGTVIIEITNTDIDAVAGGYPSETRSGTYVQMTISADGCVVHPERRIASNRTIVERLGGWMQTTNNAEYGNLHQVYLPRVEQFGGANKS